MVARGRDESKMCRVRAPLNVGPFAAPAGDVVAEGGAMLVRRKLKSNNAFVVDIDNHPLDGRHSLVASQGIFPRFEFRVPDVGAYQVHLADAALVLLKRRDLFRIRRPDEDRAVAPNPAGVIGGVTEILDTVHGQLCFGICYRIANPKIVVAYESGPAFVG